MAKRSSPLSKLSGLLEPGSVVLLTTAHRARAHVMTLSWHTMADFDPPLVGCVVSEADFSHTALPGRHPDRCRGRRQFRGPAPCDNATR